MNPQKLYRGCLLKLRFKNSVAYWEAHRSGAVVARGSTRTECETNVDKLQERKIMLNLQETFAMMGKIANNIERHGDDDVTAFEVPIESITLTQERFNALLEDPYADRWLFNDKADVREPNLLKFKPLELVDTFEEAVVVLTLGDAPFTFRDCRIKGVTLEGKRGGDILLAFSVRIRPETPEQILALIDYQNHEIKVDVQDAKVALKGGRKQQELALSQPDDDATNEEEKLEELTHPEQLFEKPKGKRGRKAKGQNGEARTH